MSLEALICGTPQRFLVIRASPDTPASMAPPGSGTRRRVSSSHHLSNSARDIPADSHTMPIDSPAPSRASSSFEFDDMNEASARSHGPDYRAVLRFDLFGDLSNVQVVCRPVYRRDIGQPQQQPGEKPCVLL